MLDLNTLSLPRLVAQMFVVRASGHLFDRQIRYPAWEPTRDVLHRWVAELGIGGVLLIDGSAAELRLRTEQLQSWAEIPLLLCADVEEGVGQRFPGATWFPPPMALGAIARRDLPQAVAWAQEMGEMLAREARAVGLNWVLAPVVDANNNPENPVINVRSFSDDPAIVAKLATAFLAGARSQSVLTTAKHFPGHGDTSVDSHWELPQIPHDRPRLERVELPPFAAAIAAGVEAVMSAHLIVPAWDETQPITMSPYALETVLRQQLGFTGLVVTDALVMGAIANRYDPGEAAVRAIEAGTDIVLMPADLEGSIAAVCEAVASGRLSRDRLLASVRRIFDAKTRVQPAPPPQPLTALDNLATPPAEALCDRILAASQTPATQPLTATKSGCNLVLVDDWLRCNFLDYSAPAIALPKQQGYAPYLVDLNGDGVPSPHIAADSVLLQVFVRGNPFGSSARLADFAEQWLNQFLKKDKLAAIAVYGSPYVDARFVTQLPDSVARTFSFGQMPAAQEIALASLFANASLDRSAIVPLA